MKYLPGIFALVFCIVTAEAQVCTNPGQTPATAFPVCGTSTFVQNNVPICGVKIVPGCSDGLGYQDKNPYWYKFTCYAAGTLGFEITPNNLADDYDWQIFDITGRDPDEVFTDTKLFVACNWSGDPGKTGTTSGATSLAICGGAGKPTYSQMPLLQQGHEYLLLVSHWTNSQSGYVLAFGGGTASITQTGFPTLSSAKPNCDATSIIVKLSRKIKCSSLAANGSDFNIAGVTITAAQGYGCSGGFDTDSLILTTAAPVPAGNHTLVAKKGTDTNTLLDYCDNALPVDAGIQFQVAPSAPTLLDSIAPVTCSPNAVRLVFKKRIRCNSIAANGSDFIINGSTPVSITSAQGNCSDGLTSTITVNFALSIVTAGTYQLQLVNGSDGNTLIDECGNIVPPGTLNFSTKDTVNANFLFDIHEGCRIDTVNFHHGGGNGINSWQWKFASEGNSNQQNPTWYFTTFGSKQVQLVVSNGFCSDTSVQQVSFTNQLVKAGFSVSNEVCPLDPTPFVNTSTGQITQWNWSFGDGTVSQVKDPATKAYPITGVENIYVIRLIVQDDKHCGDTATKTVRSRANCYIAVPSAFTPNNDGKNDQLYPANAYKADNLEFKVFNRFGQLVWQTKNWTIKWDGTVNGIMQPPGTYVWMLSYTHHDTGQKVFQKGTTVLIR